MKLNIGGVTKGYLSAENHVDENTRREGTLDETVGMFN